MKRLSAFAVLAAGLCGCSSVPQGAQKTEPPREPYASLAPAAKFDRIVGELQTIGAALQAYSRDHNGHLPPKLTDLVAQSYLPASALISSADPSGGKEGGVPDSYKEWGQASETDEPGSSYLYEFSAAPCNWDWKSYLGDKPAVSDVDANKDGVASWSEIKSWQLLQDRKSVV